MAGLGGGFTTPPRGGARPLAPPSPEQDAQFTINIIVAFTGAVLGTMKVRETTRLIDVHSMLLGAVGGCGYSCEAKLVEGANVWDKPYSTPFRGAVAGATYGVIKVPLENVVYMDHQRRLNRVNK